MIDLIAFDADDTLWHNETLYFNTQDRFKQLLSSYHSPQWIEERLYQTELSNLEYFGYGIKAFTLSMIETAIQLTGGQILGSEIQKIIDLAREMLQAEIQLFDHVPETLSRLAGSYPLMLLTKGDLFDQETKIARSGLANYFNHIEIVSDKTRDTYTALLARHGVEPARFLMVGNSLRSDILPVVELGGRAVYIPYHLTWAHEREVDLPEGEGRYYEIEHIGLLPKLLQELQL